MRSGPRLRGARARRARAIASAPPSHRHQLIVCLVVFSKSMPHKLSESERLQARAERLMPGGVNSPVRAFGAVGGAPPMIVRGEGAYLFDADGNRYIDYVGSWGPLILGHAPAAVVSAIEAGARAGPTF